MTASSSTLAPGWLRIVAIVFLLWNLMGCFMFWTQYSMTPEQIAALTPAQQTLWSNLPGWLWIVYAIAVASGAVAAALLLMRKRSALALFWVSLVCVLVHFIYNFLLGGALEVMPAAAALPLPAFIVVVAALQVWVTRKATRRGWLA